MKKLLLLLSTIIFQSSNMKGRPTKPSKSLNNPIKKRELVQQHITVGATAEAPVPAYHIPPIFPSYSEDPTQHKTPQNNLEYERK